MTTKTRTVYVAYDGSHFRTEGECVEYENGVRDAIKGLMFFDWEMNQMQYPMEDSYNVKYCVILDANRAETFFEKFVHYGWYLADDLRWALRDRDVLVSYCLTRDPDDDTAYVFVPENGENATQRLLAAADEFCKDLSK